MGWFSQRPERAATTLAAPEYRPAPRAPIPADPVEAAIHLRRFGMLVNPPAAWRAHPQFAKLYAAAMSSIDDEFCLVPAGSTSIALRLNDEPGGPERDAQTSGFVLGRLTVTNEDYQFFVDAGAYEDTELWPESVWPLLIKFRDRTGALGPRYWREGRHDRRLSGHPVVGISWYEAAAYATWAGYRLPSEAEWQVAATWQLGETVGPARRYPWGDALDLECCNIWASGHGGTLPADAFPAGASPNGVLQLIGNVWEWVQCDFECQDDEGRAVIGEAPLKTIRGGAFDTYFPWQATSTFRSGLSLIARAHNVGFRCALDLPAGEPG